MELDNVLKEERLSGASLLILLNKQDIKGALTPAEIASVYVLANELLDLKALFHVEICSVKGSIYIFPCFSCQIDIYLLHKFLLKCRFLFWTLIL
ncbi:hypothetical protein ACOSQ2_033269 [Xanthoceras sorbifolium]